MNTKNLIQEDHFVKEYICVPTFLNRTNISRIIQNRWNSTLNPKVKEVDISRKNVCLNEDCKKDIYVEIELEHSIEVDELDVDEILEILKEEIGIDTSGILIGWDIDESGQITRVTIYVDDEATAGSIADTINNIEC